MNPNSNPYNQFSNPPILNQTPSFPPQKKKLSFLIIISLLIIAIISVIILVFIQPSKPDSEETKSTGTKQDLDYTNAEEEAEAEEIFSDYYDLDSSQDSENLTPQEEQPEDTIDEPISADYGIDENRTGKKYITIIIDDSLTEEFSQRQLTLLQETSSDYFSAIYKDFSSLTLTRETDNSLKLTSESGKIFFVELNNEKIKILSSSNQELLSYDNRFFPKNSAMDFESIFEEINNEK